APDPVLVLDRDDVDALAQRLRRAEIVVPHVLLAPMVDLDRIADRRLFRRVEGDDLAVAGIGGEVAGERGNPAVLRWIRGNEGNANDGGAPRVGVGGGWAASAGAS